VLILLVAGKPIQEPILQLGSFIQPMNFS
jgi:hypothetical protein